MTAITAVSDSDRREATMAGPGEVQQRDEAARGRVKTRLLVFLALLVAAGVGQHDSVRLTEPLDRRTDLDGLMKLRGIAADPSLAAALGWFWGDDPQGVHTFRPLPALTLWVEFHLWGFTRWGYELASLLYLVLTGLAVMRLGRTLGMPFPPAFLAAVVLLLQDTERVAIVVRNIATRHDLLCALLAVMACEAQLRYLTDGSRRTLASFAGWSLGAYLCKEMALALLPLCVLLAITDRRAPRERKVASSWAALAVASIWAAWYAVAAANMGPSPHYSHSMGAMVGRLLHPDLATIWNFLFNLSWPVGSLARIAYVERGLQMFSYNLFSQQLGLLVVHLAMIGVLWKYRPRWLAVIYLWKLICYLPVAPLHDIWPWYRYMPHVLDPLLPCGALWCWAVPMNGWRRLIAWCRRELPPWSTGPRAA